MIDLNAGILKKTFTSDEGRLDKNNPQKSILVRRMSGRSYISDESSEFPAGFKDLP